MQLISTFHNFNEVVENKPLHKILDDIKAGKYKNQITHLRKCLKEEKMVAYERVKKSLVAFTPSGCFEGGRRMELLKSYSPYLVLDFDKIPKERFEDIRSNLTGDPFTLSCFTSPSGNGLKAIIQTDATAEAHKEYFLAAQEYFEKLTGYEIDKSGKDITRLCFFSWDPDVYINPNPVIFTLPLNLTLNATGSNIPPSGEPKGLEPSLPLPLPLPGGARGGQGLIFDHCVRFTERKVQFAPGSRNVFVHQLACNCNRKGLSEADTLSTILSRFNYDEKEIRTAVSSAFKNIHEHASDQDWQAGPGRALKTVDTETGEIIDESAGQPAEAKKPKKRIPYIDRIENFLNERYELRHNIVTGKLELKSLSSFPPSGEPRWAGGYQPVNDFQENSLLRELLKNGVKCNISVLRNILNSDFCKIYNPFEAYFNSLPEWDGQTDHILQLADTITTTKQDLWQYCFKKWLVAMVACALNNKIINHTVIVFSGKQGIGKTTWMENLVPAYLKNHLFSGTINPNNKDTLIHLAECMLINLDELENLNRTEIGSLKEIITKSHIRVRKAYGHNNESLPRRASFAGSVNTAQFLNDTTGSRRFLCFEVADIQYQHGIAIDSVYAQALHLYKSGFRFWFDRQEIEIITANNEQYQIKSVEEELLLTWFEAVSSEEIGAGKNQESSTFPHPGGQGNILYINASQIAAKLAEKTKLNLTDGTIIKLGKALKKHNFLRLKKEGTYVYAVRELSWDTVAARNEKQDKEIILSQAPPGNSTTNHFAKITFPEDDLPF